MKQDFGSNFLRTFNPNFANTFDTTLRFGLSQQEEERQRQELLKAQREQQGILSQLMKGSKTALNYAGKYAPLMQQEVPLNQNERFMNYSQLNPENKKSYEWWQKENAPKEKPKTEYLQFGDSLYKKDAEGNLISTPIMTKDQKPEKVWVKDENWGDKVKKLMGYENPDADVNDETTRVVNGKKFTVTDWTANDKWEKKTNSTNPNDSYWDLSDTTKATLKEYFKKQQEWRAITDAGFGNKQVDGKKDQPTYKEKLNNHNRVYLEAVRNVMPETAKGWYNEFYNGAGGNPIDDRDYLLSLKNSFSKGELGADPNNLDNYDVADFNSLLEQFKPIYGYDPRERYGQFLEKIQ